MSQSFVLFHRQEFRGKLAGVVVVAGKMESMAAMRGKPIAKILQIVATKPQKNERLVEVAEARHRFVGRLALLLDGKVRSTKESAVADPRSMPSTIQAIDTALDAHARLILQINGGPPSRYRSAKRSALARTIQAADSPIPYWKRGEEIHRDPTVAPIMTMGCSRFEWGNVGPGAYSENHLLNLIRKTSWG